MDVFDQMLNTAADKNLFNENTALLLMVSGGSDSTALARLCARLRDEGKIGVVDMLHMNHKLRGNDSDEDARFVANLAEELGIPLFACEMDIAAEAAREGGNVEAVARRERYAAAQEALFSMCQHEGIPLSDARIATAHTADDRIENFYMRSIVGTGPGGFRSMLYQNGTVIRPLLDCSRESLREFLVAQGAKDADCNALNENNNAASVIETPKAGVLNGTTLWREDATNAHTDRFRSYVRHNIVPAAREWNTSLDSTLVRTMNLIAEEDDMLDSMAQHAIDDNVKELGEEAEDGFLLLPAFGNIELPLARRAIHKLLKPILGMEERIDTQTIDAVLDGFANSAPNSGYVTNIQGNLAVSANKEGVRVEPMAAFRKRRKKD